MIFTAYGAQFILDWLFGKASNVPSTNQYLALFAVSPNSAGGGVELAIGTNGYARAANTNNDVTWAGATSSVPSSKLNAVAFTFPTATGNWVQAGFWGIFDASTNGNLICYGPLTNPVQVLNGSTYSIGIGNGQINLG